MTPIVPGPLDHLLVVVAVVLVPLYGAWTHEAFRRECQAGVAGARLRGYRETLVIEWALAAATLLVWARAGRSWADLGLDLRPTWRSAGTTALALLVLVPYFAQLRRLPRLSPAGRADLRRQMGAVDEFLPRTGLELRVFAVVALSAGICEELFFRGFLIPYVSAWIGVPAAVLVTSVTFGLVHLYQGPAGAARVAVGGAIAALVTLAAGALWPAMLLHAALDLFGGLVGHAAHREADDGDRAMDPMSAAAPEARHTSRETRPPGAR